MESITTDEYIQKLNDELRKHELYAEGMKIMAYPEGSKGRNMTGYSFTGSRDLTALIYAVQIISQQYSIRD